MGSAAGRHRGGGTGVVPGAPRCPPATPGSGGRVKAAARWRGSLTFPQIQRCWRDGGRRKRSVWPKPSPEPQQEQEAPNLPDLPQITGTKLSQLRPYGEGGEGRHGLRGRRGGRWEESRALTFTSLTKHRACVPAARRLCHPPSRQPQPHFWAPQTRDGAHLAPNSPGTATRLHPPPGFNGFHHTAAS